MSSQVEVRKHKGRMSLFIDGKPTPPILYALSDFPGAAANTHYAYKNIKNFAGRGIHLVMVDSCLHLGWHKRFPFEADAIMAEIAAVLDANPRAKVFMRLHMNPPYWWLRDNPDECIVYRTEEGDVAGNDDGEQDRLIRRDSACEIRASMCSDKWLNDASEMLTHFLEAIKGTPEGDALVGIQFVYGKNGEWHPFGADVSPLTVRKFREYLKETYKTDEALRLAWNDPAVCIATAEYRPEKHNPTGDGVFRDPRKAQQSIDSHRFEQKNISDAILHFASVSKRVSPHILCGAFYGYFFGVGLGHLCMEDIYTSPNIDFLAGPACYLENRKPTGVPMNRTLLESHRLRDMLWLTEMDQFPFGVEVKSGGTDEMFATNTAILRRNTLIPVFGGQGFWFYDHRMVPTAEINKQLGDVTSVASSIYRKRGWWDSLEMMREVGKINQFAKRFSRRKYRSDADVLLVYDTDGKYYSSIPRPSTVDYPLLEGVARCGVAYDYIFLSELSCCEIERYRCIIFAGCPVITPEKRALIKKLTKGKTTVYLFGCGYGDGKMLSEDFISETVGMTVARAAAKGGSLTLDGQNIPLPELPRPIFGVNDSEATPMAYFENGEVAAAQLGDSIYVATPFMPRELAKIVFEKSGVHTWCDSGDPIYASSDYVMINCQGAGQRTLTLPNGQKLQIETADHETAVFDTTTGERVL